MADLSLELQRLEEAWKRPQDIDQILTTASPAMTKSIPPHGAQTLLPPTHKHGGKEWLKDLAALTSRAAEEGHDGRNDKDDDSEPDQELCCLDQEAEKQENDPDDDEC